MKSQRRATRRATDEAKLNSPKKEATSNKRVKGEYKRKSKHKSLEF